MARLVIVLLIVTLGAAASFGATPGEMAIMSQQAYKSASSATPPSGWQLYAQSDAGLLSGYAGMAFRNPSTKEIVIAHRGTESPLTSPSDVFNDLQLALGFVPGQLESAKTFMQQVQSKATTDGLSGVQYSQTGHSLGAELAELMAVSTNTPATTFESPGSREVLQKMIDDKVLPPGAMSYAERNIVNYNAAPNLINTANGHVGEQYRLFPPVGGDLRLLIDYALGPYAYVLFTIQQHSADGLVPLFDPVTGQPIKAQPQSQWPTSGLACFFSLDCNADYWDKFFELMGYPEAVIEQIAQCLNGNLKQTATCSFGKITGLSWGDPHLTTFDNLQYDFQKPGEYFLCSTTDGFVVQVRQQLLSGSSSISLNTAVATLINGSRLEFRIPQQGVKLVGNPESNQTESLNGTAFVDTIIGNGGKKELHGFDGDDMLYAGSKYPPAPNESTVVTTAAVYGGAGNDNLFGSYDAADFNQLHGGSGNDFIVANAGTNQIYGGPDTGSVQYSRVYKLTYRGCHSFDACWYNVYGYFISDAYGNPQYGQIIWPCAKCVTVGSSFTLTLNVPPDQLGVFVIPDGNRANSGLQLQSGDLVTFNTTFPSSNGYAVYKGDALLSSALSYSWPVSNGSISNSSMSYVFFGPAGDIVFGQNRYWPLGCVVSVGSSIPGACYEMVEWSSGEAITMVAGDNIQCGSGNDTIRYSIAGATDGVDTVQFFDVASDRIVIEGGSANNTQLVQQPLGVFVLVTVNGSTVGLWIVGVNVTQLNALVSYSPLSGNSSNATDAGETTQAAIGNVYINGSAIQPLSVGQMIGVGSGFLVCYSSLANSYYESYLVFSPLGHGFAVTLYPNWISVQPFINIGTRTSGLLGNDDGIAENDLQLANGTAVSGAGVTVTAEQLYGAYAAAWRVTEAESLFTYQAGESTASFDEPTFDPATYVTVSSFPPTAVQKAIELAKQLGYSPGSPTFNDVLFELLAGGIDVNSPATLHLLTGNLTNSNNTAVTLQVVSLTTTSAVTHSTAATSNTTANLTFALFQRKTTSGSETHRVAMRAGLDSFFLLMIVLSNAFMLSFSLYR